MISPFQNVPNACYSTSFSLLQESKTCDCVCFSFCFDAFFFPFGWIININDIREKIFLDFFVDSVILTREPVVLHAKCSTAKSL